MGERDPGPLGGGAGEAGAALGPVCIAARAARLPGPVGDPVTRPNCAVSAELDGACSLPDAATDLNMSESERAVHAWLRSEQNAIIHGEEQWGVDRRAIAAAIAWEALKNVSKKWWTSRWSGPGKDHVVSGWSFWQNADMFAAAQVEQLGYLPAQKSAKDRAKATASVAGAISYIGAIMRSCADTVTQIGGYPPERTYWNVPALATWYHNDGPIGLAAKFRKNKWTASSHPLRANMADENKEMGTWATFHMRYLEDAVGKLPVECRPAVKPIVGASIPAAPAGLGSDAGLGSGSGLGSGLDGGTSR